MDSELSWRYQHKVHNSAHNHTYDSYLSFAPFSVSFFLSLLPLFPSFFPPFLGFLLSFLTSFLPSFLPFFLDFPSWLPSFLSFCLFPLASYLLYFNFYSEVSPFPHSNFLSFSFIIVFSCVSMFLILGKHFYLERSVKQSENACGHIASLCCR